MAKQPYYVNPSLKQVQAYQDFSGGLNTVSANERLKDNELPDVKNINFGTRGSMSRRGGMVKHFTPQTGTPQGYFTYFPTGGAMQEITVIGGKFYVNNVLKTPSDGTTIQTTRPVEAVQYEENLYIASGSGLLVYDGTNIKKVTPYTPDPMEALYIGYNGLATDPTAVLTDGTGSTLQILGVTMSAQNGIVNKPVTLTAYSDIPSGMTVQYQFNWRKVGDASYTLGQDFSTTKTYNFTPNEAAQYEFKVTVRDSVTTTDTSDYYVPTYTVTETSDPTKVTIDSTTIANCNRILLHWDRLIMYGDTSKPAVIYVSHLQNPTYFPENNTLKFENPRNEGLQAITHYRDLLVAFTNTSIQSLTGKDPSTYVRTVLNTKIGCIAPYSTAVIDNYVAFLSYSGVYILKSLVFSSDMANVQKIDINISNIVAQDVNACAASFNNQYHLVLPSQNIRLRYYYQYGIWSKDESTKLNVCQLSTVNGELYALGNDGAVYQFDDTVYDDDGYVYDAYFETKSYDFGMPYNPKKLKELQLLLSNVSTTQSYVEVYADDSLVLNTTQSSVSIDANGNVIASTTSTPNAFTDGGTVFGTWDLGKSAFGHISSVLNKFNITGKCRFVKITMTHSDSKANEVLGLAFIYKTKKPK